MTGAPVVFVCNNNQWAISTPLDAQTRAASLADKAIGYGIPGVRVDGLDVLAVYEATREAVERARAGGGPTFIEAVHYRAAPHATADDPRAYIDAARVAGGAGARVRRPLRRLPPPARACSPTSSPRRCKAEAEAALRAGIAAAEAEAPPDPELLFSNAYVDPPPGFQRWLS